MLFVCNKKPRVPRRPSLSRATAGFTLAEVMVAIMILGVASVAAYGGFATSFMLIDSARQELRASQILTQKAEGIRLCSWSTLTNCPIAFTERYDPANGTNGGTLYSGRVTIGSASPISSSANYKTNMSMVTVTLFWTNYCGKQPVTHARTLETLVARYGVQNYIWGTAP
jgi:prepilin-type N-terminal cleavage/methylation domain-containing protein